MSDPIKGSAQWIKAEQAKVASGQASGAGLNVGKWLGLGCGIPLGIVLIFVLATVLWPKDNSTIPTTPEVSKYTQTWDKQYSATTCTDWLDQMSGAQRFAAAADILTSARNKIDGGTGLPPDSLISEFEGGITNVCVIPSMTLTDATYGLYATEPRFHP